MTSIAVKPPFRADHVGSLLRPERIHQARNECKEGTITAAQLHEIETQEIKRIVDKQIEIGLELVTDGEFRRRFWHTDFLEHLNGVEGYVPEVGYIFQGNEETERYNVRNVGKISFNHDHPHVKDFIEFNKIVGGVQSLSKPFRAQINCLILAFVMKRSTLILRNTQKILFKPTVMP